MKAITLILLVIFFVLCNTSYAQPTKCSAELKEQLIDLKKVQFNESNDETRQSIALNMLACLQDQDPAIRDGIVYEGLSLWLRGNALTIDTITHLFEQLTAILARDNTDTKNFEQPFAALVLSEVVRVDRITPFLSTEQREHVIQVIVTYFNDIEDYRGFNDIEGWRHAIAHSADVFLQLALNEAVNKQQLTLMLEAISGQIVAKANHFYRFGEPKRMAMPVVYVLLRGEHSESEINAYFERISAPSPYKDWSGVYTSEHGLAKLHNTRAFLYSVFAIIGKSNNPQLIKAQPALEKAIKSLG